MILLVLGAFIGRGLIGSGGSLGAGGGVRPLCPLPARHVNTFEKLVIANYSRDGRGAIILMVFTMLVFVVLVAYVIRWSCTCRSSCLRLIR